MRVIKTIYLLLTTTILLLLLISPEPCKKGVVSGLMICGNVIIPSLFPFTVFVLFLLKCDIIGYLAPLSKFTKYVFGQNIDMFGVMLLSFIGGYPIGGRLIKELCAQGRITKENARIMLCYCVNGGPAFIVITVGSGLLNSTKAGVVLLASHIAVSLILALICRRFIKEEKDFERNENYLGFADALVSAVADASGSILGICSYVILFSAINNYINFFSEKYFFLKPLSYITEVTSGLINTDNIYRISALLGFGGMSIWCQVISEVKKISIKIDLMIIARFFHAILSSLFTYVMLRFFPITLQTFSNLKGFDYNTFSSTPDLGICLFIMTLLFLISLFNKNRGGNLLSDIV